jgi:hypothetical protein
VNEKRLSRWQRIVRWNERRLAKRAIEHVLRPLLERSNAFQPHPPHPELGTWCQDTIGPLFPFTRIELWGSDDSSLPPRPFISIGQYLENRVHYASRIGYRRDWIDSILADLFTKYLGTANLPETPYDRVSSLDILYHLCASILTGSMDPYLYSMAEMDAMGNEPLYLGGSEKNPEVLYIRCYIPQDFQLIQQVNGPPITIRRNAQPVPP